MFWTLLLLVAVVAAVVWAVRGRRPAAPPANAYEQAPAATDWGRPMPPAAQQPGMGGQVMGGLATGLAIGAGALAAQEIGRHMLGGERSQHAADAGDGGYHHGGSAADSPLARDAGLDAVGRGDSASWDDGGLSFGGDDGGGDAGGGWDA